MNSIIYVKCLGCPLSWDGMNGFYSENRSRGKKCMQQIFRTLRKSTVNFHPEVGRISSIRSLSTMSKVFTDIKGSKQPMNTKPVAKGLANLFYLCPQMEFTRKLLKCISVCCLIVLGTTESWYCQISWFFKIVLCLLAVMQMCRKDSCTQLLTPIWHKPCSF